jgi:GTP-binding protein
LGVEKELFKKGAVAGSEVRVGTGDDAVIFDWEPTIESGAELLGARGEDVRFDSIWRGPEKVHDQLSDEELARQWEFSIADPRTPVLVEELVIDKEVVAEDEAESEEHS